MTYLLDLAAEPIMFAAFLTAILAGLVRGFSGFGTSLIYVPVATILLGPQMAATTIYIVDALLILPFLPKAFRAVDWRELVPMALGSMALVPVGTWALANVDPVPFRWFLSLAILLSLALLLSGIRWRGRNRADVSAGVGALAGFLSGFAQMPGPPVLVYWLGRNVPPASIRANSMVVFLAGTAVAGVSYALAGFFTTEAVARAALLLPAYGVGLFAGAKLFPYATPGAFRALAYSMIAFIALASLPALDPWLR